MYGKMSGACGPCAKSQTHCSTATMSDEQSNGSAAAMRTCQSHFVILRLANPWRRKPLFLPHRQLANNLGYAIDIPRLTAAIMNVGVNSE